MNENDITLFGITNFRNKQRRFGIKRDDRRRHFYAIGKTGMGKTAMLENMAIQDIVRGEGVGFIDPHGEASQRVLSFVPKERINDVIYFNPSDVSYAMGFNVMESVDQEYRHLVASGLMGVFKKIWPDVWSARMEYILNNTILALLESPNSTLLGINRMMADTEYRNKVTEKVTDPVVKSFWMNEFARYSEQYAVEATAAIQNKIGQFISNPLIRNIVGQVTSSINMREIMDNRKVLIMNLSKGKIGEDNSMLLGGLLVTKLQLAAMSRVEIPEPERKDFFLYIDEFQNFATRSFVNILSEARKYRLSLILGHQYISQMEEEVEDAVFGNMGTIVSFRVGSEDAERLEKEFAPDVKVDDLINLPKYNIYAKLMINGVSGRPFSATTIPPWEGESEKVRDKIIRTSIERYATERSVVEEKLSRWLGDFQNSVVESTKDVYDAQCSKCGKKTKVPFVPDGTRPTYCKTCRKSLKKEESKPQKQEQSAENLKEALKTEKKPQKEETNKLKEVLREHKKKQQEPSESKSLKEALREALRKK